MTYDTRGRRVSDTRGAVGSSYDYDGGSRLSRLADDLAGSVDDVATTFDYNPAGQIVSKTRSNGGYAFGGYVAVDWGYGVNGLNQYTSAGPATFVYDNNGNLTGDGSRSYSFDVQNRLVGASGGVSLSYDPAGGLWQTVGAQTGTTRFLYDGDELVAEYDMAGNVLRRYLHGADADDPQLWYEGAGLIDRRSLQK